MPTSDPALSLYRRIARAGAQKAMILMSDAAGAVAGILFVAAWVATIVFCSASPSWRQAVRRWFHGSRSGAELLS